MQSSYKRLGDYIREVKGKNTGLRATLLLGINIDKFFMPSVANVVGTDMANYRLVSKNQFACNRMHVGRDYRIPIALSNREEPFMVSPAYDVFEIIDPSFLLPEYLMMWFSRKEFDRNAWFHTDADVRGGLPWKLFCDLKLPIPSPEKQLEIVREYNVIQNRIKLNNQLIAKLEETAQAIYKQWFVDFEFPDENGLPYKTSGGEMIESDFGEIPMNWTLKRIEEFAELKYGKMLDSDLFLESGFPVFSGYGIRGFYSHYMFEEPEVLVLCRGVSGTGEVRMSPPFSYITNLSIVVLTNEDIIKKMYLFYFLKNGNLKSLDSGSAQSQITTGDLYAQFVMHPEISIQEKFEKIAQNIRLNITTKENSTRYLNKLKELILAKMTIVEMELT